MVQPFQNPPAAAARVPRPAASVVMLRDGSDGLEVLMLKRHGLSEVHGGAFVFPGGKVDAEDAVLQGQGHLDAPAQLLHRRLGEAGVDEATAAGFFVAAIRETFEESGLLLAHDLSPQAAAEAAACLREGVGFNAMLATLRLRLQCDALVPWSRWITPPDSPNKRFDTRFFAVRAPAGGEARHDGRETTETVWLRPRPALQSYWDGAMQLAPPQIMTLAHLARYDNVDQALTEARGRPPALIEPHIKFEAGMRIMCYPGDAEHPVAARAMQRVEPAEGFDAFFR
jgi:8-oxo-dGTP pyrophosphatase MutT (NUDIX family)